ncbi:uncharacterized protein LOC112050963 isoform X2 [Bicyclus anynana]|uniref:Uncharacterized protein LOC112050963 isoform X2 n=1 Tax=Bicyclus anynana TaxID=110368 RepID=A0ABM3LXF0_BICAN|nr:uncharacterized protein LOC112050963 isoform X2 [Bicyclus anynana]
MPDTLSLSAGVSLGLLAGIVSGVCYLFANGLTRTGDERKPRRRCIAPKENNICVRCGGDQLGGPVPCICLEHRQVKFESGAWFLRQAQRALSLMPWSFSTDRLDIIDEEECEGPSSSEGRGDLHNVREFLEAISARLTGGTLEGTRVAPLYDHPAYLPQQHSGPSHAGHGPSLGASGAHAQLKRLVARVVEEAAALPALAQYAAEPQTPTESSTYEDLLATAILNKVIERYQTENGSGGRSSGIHSASASPSPSDRSSPRSLHSRTTRDITPPREDDASDWEEGEATDDALEVPRRVPFPEYGGDIVHATDNDYREFDEVSGSDIQAADGSWEENWLFQKKKIKNIQSAPVPMLVPNSNTQYRALIGDRDAEDTTDLSDNASDADEQEVEYKSDAKKVLDSKHVIGGKPKVDEVLDFEPDSLTILDESQNIEAYNEKVLNEDTVDSKEPYLEVTNDITNGNIVNEIHNDNHDSILLLDVDSGPLSKTEFNLKEEIHRSIMNGHGNYSDDTNINGNLSEENDQKPLVAYEKGTTNTLSRFEREKDYEETVTVPVQRYADSLRRKHFEEPQQCSTPKDEENDLIPGSIAYRERKKWLNYVDMPNNPYSPEAIKRRLTAKSTSSLFDSLTTNKDRDIEKLSSCEDVSAKHETENNNTKETVDKRQLKTSLSTDEVIMNNRRSMSPSPKILRNVMSEDLPHYKRYDRDYYIKEARSSSGERKGKSSISSSCSLSNSINKSTSLDNFDREFASPGLLIQQFNTIATNQQYLNFDNKNKEQISITTMPGEYNNEVIIDYEDANEHALFVKPTYTDDDTDQKFEEILQTAYSTDKFAVTTDKIIDESDKSPTSFENSLSSSSVEDSIKIYNVQTGEIVKCTPEDKLSRRYAADKNDNINIPDNNSGGTIDIVNRLSESENSDATDAVETDSFKEAPVKSEIDDLPTELPNVRELAKKFVSMESLNEPVKVPQPSIKRHKSKENIFSSDYKEKPGNKLQYMHSLTARSISREFREELKLSMPTPLTVPGGAKDIPEGEEVTRESSRPGSPVPEPGTIKSKLAFFESLKSKFSSK